MDIKEIDPKILVEDDVFSLYVAENLATGDVEHWTLRPDDMLEWCRTNCHSRGGEISHYIHVFRRDES